MRFAKTVALLVSVALLATTLPATTIKIGSIAPDRSPWNDALQEMAREWLKITGGQVELKIYAGGIAGGEDDMIRKIRVGTLGGAAMTNLGLTHIYADSYVLNIPFLFDSDAELNAVLDRMKPVFEKRIEEKGFKVVIWTLTGWLNFFTKGRLAGPEDLKKSKMSFTTGEPEMEQAWKKMGYRIVPTELKDLMMALQSGMVDSFYLPPVIAGSGQYFPFAPHMLDLKVAPLLGGIVIADRVWKTIPAQYHGPMMASAQRIGAQLMGKIQALESKTLVTMKQHGLIIDAAPQGALQAWRAVAGKGTDELVGKAFSREVYDQMMARLLEYRQQHGK